MHYLYHRVPENMRGTTLYPLNQLRDAHPDVYAEAIKKYENRERVMRQVVIPFGCAWNDVLHFSPVHPSFAKSELQKYGRGALPMAFL